MSEICRFFGIIITMYFREHNPPHFHARYGEFQAEIDINGVFIRGQLPPRIAGFILEWLLQHRQELIDNWTLMQTKKSPLRIKPLE